MGHGMRALLGIVVAVIVAAAPPKPAPPPPQLLPGEALVLAGPDREVFGYGETLTESPMGGLSHLPWVKLEGDIWASGAMQFKCTGAAGPFKCTGRHGRVDLSKAFLNGCNLAFMAWARMSAQRWQDDYGDGAARARLVDAFQPFLDRRLPFGDGVPTLDMAWFGEGDLLRTSPDALLRWLIDPAQEEAVRLFRRLLLTFYDETFKENAWWVDAETTPAAGAPEATQAWAVGGNGIIIAVLRLPPGSTRATAMARFRAILVGTKKK